MKQSVVCLLSLALLTLCACNTAAPEHSLPADTTAAVTVTETAAQPPDTTQPPAEWPQRPEEIEAFAAKEGFRVAGSSQMSGKDFDYTAYELVKEEDPDNRYFIVAVWRSGAFVALLRPMQDYSRVLDEAPFPILERDVDFDGTPDVLLYTGHYGNQMGVNYDCWLRRGDQLVYCPSFYDIMNPAVSKATKEIFSSSRGSAVTHVYIKYQFIDEAFVPVAQLVEMPADWEDSAPRQSGDDILWGWSISEYVDGEWQNRRFSQNDYSPEELLRKVGGENSPWAIYSDSWRSLYNDGLMADGSIYRSRSTED